MIQLTVGRMVRFESQERLGMSVLIKWGQHCDMCRNTHLQGGGVSLVTVLRGPQGFAPFSASRIPSRRTCSALCTRFSKLNLTPWVTGHLFRMCPLPFPQPHSYASFETQSWPICDCFSSVPNLSGSQLPSSGGPPNWSRDSRISGRMSLGL